MSITRSLRTIRRRRILKNQRANLMIEYAVLLVIILAAFLGLSVYFKRAICGRWRQSADTFGYGRQYQYEETRGLNP